MLRRPSELVLDAKNVKLLRLLRDDPRLGIAELARAIGMSAPAVRERLQRLEEAGVIQGYRIDIDPRALGYPIAAILRVWPMPGQHSYRCLLTGGSTGLTSKLIEAVSAALDVG
jgi:Lrp/AsnC family transcriptional regulator, leucine-responsive regulatory protein